MKYKTVDNMNEYELTQEHQDLLNRPLGSFTIVRVANELERNKAICNNHTSKHFVRRPDADGAFIENTRYLIDGEVSQ